MSTTISLVDNPAAPTPTTLTTKLAGEDLTADRMVIRHGFTATRIQNTTDAQTISAANFHGLTINKGVDTKTLTLADGTNTLAVVTCSGAVPVSLSYGIDIEDELIVTPNDTGLDVTISWG